MRDVYSIVVNFLLQQVPIEDLVAIHISYNDSNLSKLPAMKEALAEPHVEAVERTRDFPDLSKGHGAVSQAIQDALQVKEAAVGLDAQVIQSLRCVPRHVLAKTWLRVKAAQDVALHVQGHVASTEVVQGDLAKTWKYQ